MATEIIPCVLDPLRECSEHCLLREVAISTFQIASQRMEIDWQELVTLFRQASPTDPALITFRTTEAELFQRRGVVSLCTLYPDSDIIQK